MSSETKSSVRTSPCYFRRRGGGFCIVANTACSVKSNYGGDVEGFKVEEGRKCVQEGKAGWGGKL